MSFFIAFFLVTARLHYFEIPAMGRITSLAASFRNLVLANDNYLIFLDKEKYQVLNSVRLAESPRIVGYDIETADFWAVTEGRFLRIDEFTYSIREFRIEDALNIRGFAIGPGFLYWYKGAAPVRLNKRSGRVETVSSVPQDAQWFKLLSGDQLRQYPFLSPYYLEDEKFNRYPITSLAEDGINLYIGTRDYGIFRYNKLTWESKHIAFAPYASPIRRIVKENNRLYFLSDNSVSFYDPSTDSFANFRYPNRIDAFIPFQNRFIISSRNRLLSIEANFVYPISEALEQVTTFSRDGENILLATRDGLYELNPVINATEFIGLENITINKILPDSSVIYAATESGLFQYDRQTKNWEHLTSMPFRDIIKYGARHYLISTNNQLYEYAADTMRGLPYMNITCLESDGRYLYLGTLIGLAIFDPVRNLYRPAPFLPKEKINSVVLTPTEAWLLTDRTVLKIALSELVK